MKKIFVGMMLMVMATCSMAEFIETALTCRVSAVLKRKDAVVGNKSETITLEVGQRDEIFSVGGVGEVAAVLGSNNPNFPNISNINDRSTSSTFDVDFVIEFKDTKTEKIYFDDYTFRLDRISGRLNSTRTVKAYNGKITTTGVCEKANKKF